VTRYQKILLIVFALVWLWSAIRPKYPHDWMLENILVVVFVPAIILLGRYLKLSSVSYTLITIFMCLHVMGAHYTYSQVPFGYTLQSWLGASRNMYDRLVHFSFGFLLAYPVREVFLRVARSRGFWGFYLPLDLTLSFSAIFEIFEWLVAANVNPEAGMAYLGSQGDIWDAQKDMLLAGAGAALAMLIIATINWRYNPSFGAEMKESFTVPRGDHPLGEELLEKWRRRRTRA
jgi:putative membrane protein